jgi:hypothetical protein
MRSRRAASSTQSARRDFFEKRRCRDALRAGSSSSPSQGPAVLVTLTAFTRPVEERRAAQKSKNSAAAVEAHLRAGLSEPS